jgi:hypothetical protein
LNTFFPTLQLFFESGLSCTIDGSHLPDAIVGLDPLLRFRLTDGTYEEEGRIVKTMRPDKFAQSGVGIAIKEAVIAQRTSIAVKPAHLGNGELSRRLPSATVAQETHTVVGLRLEGMSKMNYIWAKRPTLSSHDAKTWGDVRLSGLRDDVPAPNLGFAMYAVKPGGEVEVVAKKSQVSSRLLWRESREVVIR